MKVSNAVCCGTSHIVPDSLIAVPAVEANCDGEDTASCKVAFALAGSGWIAGTMVEVVVLVLTSAHASLFAVSSIA